MVPAPEQTTIDVIHRFTRPLALDVGSSVLYGATVRKRSSECTIQKIPLQQYSAQSQLPILSCERRLIRMIIMTDFFRVDHVAPGGIATAGRFSVHSS